MSRRPLLSVLQDLRYGIRQLRNNPVVSIVAIATMALAMGANTAMFSFVNGVLLRPLPYPDADRIVRVLERLPNGRPNSISTLNYIDWTKQNDVFEYMAAEAGWRATLTGGDEPVSIQGARVSTPYFDIFGVTPALGRTFLPGEDQPGKDRVVLLSHALWRGRFGSDAGVLGRHIVLDGEGYTVIGVLPQGGPFDRAAAQIWTPLAFGPPTLRRDFRWLGASAKLKPGLTLDEARAGMDVIGQRLADAHPTSNQGWGVAVDRLSDVLISPGLRTAVTVLFAATFFVLLIGCGNLASLALARGISRQSEIAIRAALGAGRWRLMRLLLVENIVVALCGGSVAVGVGYMMLKTMQSLIPLSALPPAVDIRLDIPVLLFTLFLSLVTGLLFRVAPAAQVTNPRVLRVPTGVTQGTTANPLGRRLRSRLVVAEVALAFVLLVASGLLMRSFFKLLDIDPGFTATNVLTASLPIPHSRHPDALELNAYLGSITAAVKAVPGVREAALSSALPLQGGGYGVAYSIAGREPMDRADRRRAFFKVVSPQYVDALGIKLVAGRAFSETDRPGTARVAIVNETLARREFPGESPLGRRIVVQEIVPGTTQFGREVAWEIVGVIAGEKITGLGDAISPAMYVSNQQSPTYDVKLIARTGMPPLSLHKAVRSAVTSVSKDQALSDVRTLEEIVEQSMLGNRVVSTLLAAFAAIALLLAAVGIYGVTSYTVLQRTREMAIRSALGASARNLRILLVWGAMRVLLFGLAIGMVFMLPANDVLSSMLYGVGTFDVFTVAVAGGVLSLAGGLACFLPAMRITKRDPLEGLRYR